MTARPGLVPALAGVLALLLGWQLLALGLQGRAVLAGPVEVWDWLRRNAGLVGRALAETSGNAALGFLAGNLAAMALAGVVMLWPRGQGLVTGLALVVFCLPLIATGPVLRVLMGPGAGPQIALAALAVQYTTLVALLTGLRAVPSGWLDLVRSLGRGRWAELVHVRARAALPYGLAGLQIAAPAAFLGAMVGEFTGAERGLGVLTIRYMRALDVPALWGIALVAALASMAAHALIGAIARWVLHAPPPLILAPPQPVAGRGVGAQALLLVAVTLVLWQGAIWLAGLSPFFAKGPGEVWAALTLAPDAGARRAALLAALGQSAGFAIPGYLAGLGLGAGLAVLVTLAPALSAPVMALAVTLRAVPIVTTAPVIVLVLGRGAAGTVALVALMVFFPTLIACLYGLRQAPGQILDLFRVHEAGRLRQMLHIRLPAMLPGFFAAARMAVPAAVLAVTVVEWLTTGRGLGALMALAASSSDYRLLWSAVVLVTLLTVLGHAAVASLERRVLRVFAPEQVAP